MSTKYSTTGPLLARDESKSRESHIYSGQKSSHFTNKKGIDASIDKRNMELHEQARMAKYGSGVTRFAILNGDGQFDKEAVFESGGILFRPNKNGQFFATNESFLEEELRKEEEIRDYVKKILKYCVNDETNKMIFGLKDKEYKDLFGPCTPAKMEEYGARPDTIPKEVAELNCMASYMETLLPDSQSFHACTQKLIMIVRAMMPMIRGKEETREKAEGEAGAPTPFTAGGGGAGTLATS